jgi:hypothetical protein
MHIFWYINFKIVINIYKYIHILIPYIWVLLPIKFYPSIFFCYYIQ